MNRNNKGQFIGRDKKVIKCIRCGKEKLSYYGKNRKYCSNKCYWGEKIKSKCLNCNKDISYCLSQNKKYCSSQCYWISKKTIKPKDCLICNKQFIKKNHHNSAKFCSIKCSSVFHDKRIKKNCLICEREMLVHQCKKDRKKFCSKECFGKYQSKFYIKENHPSWKGGIKKDRDKRKSYEMVNWRKKVFERDDYRCFDCGIRGKYLQPHHIWIYSKYKRLRAILENGITVCILCHKIRHKSGVGVIK